MDRRMAALWIVAAPASLSIVNKLVWAEAPPSHRDLTSTSAGYGTDPALIRRYYPGELWPLSFTSQQRLVASTLCDLIIPADSGSPSASQVGVVEFLDEWISAPYEVQRRDRRLVLNGFEWLNIDASDRFGKPFVEIGEAQQRQICDDICYLAKAKPQFKFAAQFFARYRDLTAGGFYTTPLGRSDVKYVGNVPLSSFEGPPGEVLEKLGLAASNR